MNDVKNSESEPSANDKISETKCSTNDKIQIQIFWRYTFNLNLCLMREFEIQSFDLCEKFRIRGSTDEKNFRF